MASKPAQPDPDAIEERRQQRQDDQHIKGLDQQNHASAEQTAGIEGLRQVERGVIQELTESDIELPGGSMDLLQMLLGKDLVLGNYTDEKAHEITWSLRLKEQMFFDLHPRNECVLTGVVAEAYFDDAEAGLEPLSPKEVMRVKNAFENARSRVTRGKSQEGMAQQNTFMKSISESITDAVGDDEQSKGGLLDRL